MSFYYELEVKRCNEMTTFKKKLELGITPKKATISHKQIRNWFSKWDRTIAAITAFIIFCALLAIVIVNIKVFDSDTEDEDDDTKSSVYLLKSSEPRCYPNTDGTVQCSNMDSSDLKDALNSYANSGASYVAHLVLGDIRFTDNEIRQGWLEGVNLTFNHLTISPGANPIAIGERALQGEAFKSLKYLTLSEITISGSFRREMFEGTSLTDFELACRTPLDDVEEDAFGTVTSIERLQFQKCFFNYTMVAKITGSTTTLSRLIQLNLQYNGLETITATTFKSAPYLKILWLSFSNIQSIELGAFHNLSLETLDLRYNGLTTLPENVFQGSKGIAITNNPFKCDCDLLWLKLFLEASLASDPVFMCSNGSCITCDNGDSFEEVDFCGENTTSRPNGTTTVFPSEEPTEPGTAGTPSTPDDGTTDATTVAPSPYEVICGNYQIQNVSTSSLEKVASISVREEGIFMDFNYCQSTETYILVITGDKAAKQNLLWINAQNKSERYCVTYLNSGVKIELQDLKVDNTYIFCAMSPGEDSVSPLDCGAWTVPISRPDEAVGSFDQNYKIYFICGICGSFLVAAIVSGLIVFYCIRQNPSLIKGNKRVIIVGSEATEAIVMPKNYYDEISYKPPSLNSRSNGYLTPRHNGSYPRRSGSYLRTISENTAFVVPSTSGLNRMKRSHYRRRTRLEHVTHAFDDHIYEPPPLPPNHPLGLCCSDSFNHTYSRV